MNTSESLHIRALLVEDDPGQAFLFQETLAEAPFLEIELEHVARVSEALIRLAESAFDIVILDLVLPDSQGLETLRWVRHHVNDIPIVVLSGLDDAAVGRQAVQEGAEDFLVKGYQNEHAVVRCLTYAVERHRTRRALRESEARYRHMFEASEHLREFNGSIIETMGEGLVVTDFTDRITFVNQRMPALLGYPPETLIGQRWSSFVRSTDRQPADPDRTRSAQAEIGAYEATLIGNNRREIAAKITATPFRQTTETAGTLRIITDIGDRIAAEQALRRSSAQMATVAEALTTYLESGDWDRASAILIRGALEQTGSEFGMIGLLRDFGEIEFSVSRRGLRGSSEGGPPGHELVGTTSAPSTHPIFRRVLSEAEPLISNIGGIIPDLESLFPGIDPVSSLLAQPIICLNETVGLIAVASSVSSFSIDQMKDLQLLSQTAGILYDSYRRSRREHELEAQLLQSQKMEALGRLAGGISHDFNNLLTVISGYADVLLEEADEDSALKSDLGQIKESAARATGLINQLMTFSRRQVLQLRPLNLNTVIENMGSLLQRLIGEDIQLAATLEPGLGQIQADRGQMEQVVMNLVVNARDAMPDGGSLTIATASVDVDQGSAMHRLAIRPGPYALMTIADTGVGMSRETQEHIFEPFFTTKEPGKGTGLGLSTVYGIVKQIGGTIEVQSEPGRGTTFQIYLPRIETADTSKPDEGVEKDKRLATVLIVEDDEGVRGLTRRIVQSSGFRVLEAADSEQALKVCERQNVQIDIVLTDIILPGLNGPDLWRLLRLMRPEVKVLFMSGYTDETVVNRGILDMDAPYIAKPFAPKDLVIKLREILGVGPSPTR